MTYGLQREALRFVGEMNPFIFSVFGLVDAPNETGSCPMGERVLASLGDLRPEDPRSGPTLSLVQRSDGQHRVSKGGQKLPTPALRLWSVFEAAPAALRTRPPVGSPGRERVAQKRTQVVETIGAHKLVRLRENLVRVQP
jgi:hypothetical protein